MSEADTSIKRLFREMRRRRIFRTVALYIVGTWLVMQVADVVFPALDIEERAIRYVLFAAILGFLPAIIFGWFYDVGAHGIHRTGPARPGEADEALPIGRSDYIILTALAGVAIAIVYGAVGNVVETPRKVYEEVRTGPPMVAVLPFMSTSLGDEGEFFATGVHDDLLTQLSRLQSIRVISRTSVMEFRDAVRNIREIGKKLGADVILEGGVQIAGDQIRINAQLIDAHTDEHLWAETYNRVLSAANIFDVQQEIARAITTAMSATLTTQDNLSLSSIPTENMAAYREYRRAMAGRTSHQLSQRERAAILEEAVHLDPLFVRAWAELAGTYAINAMGLGDNRNHEYVELAEQAVEKIREIGPETPEYLVAQSYYLYYIVKDYDQALNLLSQALNQSPSDVDLLELKSWIQRRQGDFDGRETTMRTLVRLDPRNKGFRAQLARHLVLTHQYDAALAAIEAGDQADINLVSMGEMLRIKDHGDFGQWLAALKVLFEGREESGWWELWYAYVANHDWPNAAAVLERVDRQAYGRSPHLISGWEEIAIVTYWMMSDQERLQPLLIDARRYLEEVLARDGGPGTEHAYLQMAVVAGAEGDADESLRFVRQWEKWAAQDWAGRILSRDSACAVLGQIGSAAAAVNCIKTGLREPSFVVPFIEPYMPYYDPVRESPEFVELMAEIEQSSL